MKLYMYHKNTNEFLGATDAHIDPLESAMAGRDIYVIPPNCTPLPPLKEVKGEVNVFNKEEGVWELVEDFRGLEVYDKKGNSKRIKELGSIPEGYSIDKVFNIQEEKIKLISILRAKYEQANIEEMTLGKIIGNVANSRMILEQLKGTLDSKEFEVYTSLNRAPVIVNKEDVLYASKYLYIRSLLLSIRRNAILKEIKLAKTEKQLNKIKIDFNVKKETENLVKKSDEEINDFIRTEINKEKK